jgi:hypothetical protein
LPVSLAAERPVVTTKSACQRPPSRSASGLAALPEHGRRVRGVDLSSAGAVFGLAAAIVAVAGGVFGAYRGLAALYRQTVGSRRALAGLLYQLAAGVSRQWVEERLGAPAFVRGFDMPNSRAKAVIREFVYHAKHAWVQVLLESHDAVIRFSVTVTDPRFSFQVRDLTANQLAAKLGRTTFSDVGAQDGPLGRSLRIEEHNFEYAEAYYFEDQGYYQWFVLSYNDAGAGHRAGAGELGVSFQDGVLALGDEASSGPPPSAAWERFRAGTVVNTLTVLGPWHYQEYNSSWGKDSSPLGSTGLAEPRGADTNQVRVLVPDARERRQWARRFQLQQRELKRQAESAHPKVMPDIHEEIGGER